MSDLQCCRLERTESYLDHLLQPALKLRAFLDDFLGFVALTLGSAGLEIRLTGAIRGNLRGGRRRGLLLSELRRVRVTNLLQDERPLDNSGDQAEYFLVNLKTLTLAPAPAPATFRLRALVGVLIF